jgi:hypothetical protein
MMWKLSQLTTTPGESEIQRISTGDRWTRVCSNAPDVGDGNEASGEESVAGKPDGGNRRTSPGGAECRVLAGGTSNTSTKTTRKIPQRILSLAKSAEVEQILTWAEDRLETGRENTLPPTGSLPEPVQLFEIRWKGRGEIQPEEAEESVKGMSALVRGLESAIRPTKTSLRKTQEWLAET